MKLYILVVSFALMTSELISAILGNKFKYVRDSDDNGAPDCENDYMGRCFRTVSFRQEPENIEDSFHSLAPNNDFDIIADTIMPNDAARNNPIYVTNTFKWDGKQKQQLYNAIHRADSNVNFGGNDSVGCKTFKIDSNVPSDSPPKEQSNRTSSTEIPNLEYRKDEWRKMSFGQPKSKFYESNALAQTKTTDKLRDSLG